MVQQRQSRTRNHRRLLEFSIRSLAQAYGWAFVRHVILRHPLRTWRGLAAYVQMSWADQQRRRLLYAGGPDASDEFVSLVLGDGGRLLVATGFCQKPLRGAGGDYDCPAGRFNHDCLYLSCLDLGSAIDGWAHPACATCSIAVLGRAALTARASFAILTSAMDIAHDVLRPALEERRFAHALVAICPYSVEPMTLALLTCGMDGCFFRYNTGACANYGQWLRADRGDKPERTALSANAMATVVSMLDAIATWRDSAAGTQCLRYKQVGHIFQPC